MNEDIRLSVDFWTHPKTGKLIQKAGLEGPRSLQILWIWVAKNRPDGCLDGLDRDDIEFAADWRGEPGLFFDSIVDRWLDTTETGFSIHDWQDHNPWASEANDRSDAARLSRLCRNNPNKGKELKDMGIKGISKDEYRNYVKCTTVQRPYNDRITTEVRIATTPAPAPAPAPDPTPIVVKSIVGKLPVLPTRKCFYPPTVEEVTAYCREERKNSVDPQLWHDHYTSNGWVVGKTKMKCWKAAVRTWEKNGQKTGQQRSGEKISLKEQRAREIIGYGSKNGDSEESYFDMGSDFPREPGNSANRNS